MLKQVILTTALFAATASANHLINISTGAVWPQDEMIKSTDSKAMWNISGSWGRVFDKRVVVGLKADLAMHVQKFQGKLDQSRTTATDTFYVSSDNIYRKERAFMLPLCGWVAIDPIPQYRFHPVINAQVGYNSLFWSESNYDDGSGIRKDDDFKYWYGFYSKFGIDGMFDLGKQASIFAGFAYQVAPLNHQKDNKLQFKSFNAPELHIGVSFLY